MGNVMLKKDIGQKWGMCRRMKKAVALFLFVILIVANIDKEMILGFAVDSDGFFDSYTIVGNPRLFGIDDDSDDEHGWNPLSKDQRFTDAGNGYYMAKFTCIFAGEYEFKIIGDGDFLGWNAQLCFGNPDTAWSDNQSTLKVKLEADEYTVVMNPSQGLVVCVQNGKVADFSVRYKSRDEDSVNFVEPSVEAVRADGYDPQDFDANLAAFKIKALEIANTESVVNIGDRFVVEGLEYEVIGSEEVAVSRLEDQNITDLVIPEKVTYAEKGFKVTSVGNRCIIDNSSLSSIYIPESVTNIDLSFWRCESLKEINVHNNNIYYMSEEGVLFDKNKTELIYYPQGKEGEYEIPEGVIVIKSEAFGSGDNLTSIMIPDSLINIPEYEFLYCSNLVEIKVSNNNPQYTSEKGVLFNKNKTELICYPRGKEGEYKIPEGVLTIGGGAFEYSYSLTSITLPDSLTRIIPYRDDITGNFGAFWGCENLEEINVSDKNIKYTSEEGVLFNEDKTELIRFPANKKIRKYIIPFGVKIINIGAFASSGHLINVVIPEGVKSIKADVFFNCINLTSVIIPESVTDIVTYKAGASFTGCDNLTIYSTENSYAHSFALEFDIPWAPLTVNPSATIEILEGKDMQYIGTGDYILRLDKEPDKFMDVLMDGIPVDPSNYTVTEGSTIITFSENYLRTLQEGEHIIKVNFTDGYAETTLTILSSDLPSNKESAISENNKEAAAKTGDEMSSVLLGVLFTSVVTAVIVSVKKKISN